jgi:hypothetical protein
LKLVDFPRFVQKPLLLTCPLPKKERKTEWLIAMAAAKAGLVLEHHMSIDLQAAEIRVAVSDGPGTNRFQSEIRPTMPARNSN